MTRNYGKDDQRTVDKLEYPTSRGLFVKEHCSGDIENQPNGIGRKFQ